MADSFVLKDRAHPGPSGKKRAVFVTGAAGRIGSYFAEHSHDRYDLTLMVETDGQAGKVEGFGRVVVAELSDFDRLKELMQGTDTVVHLAANASPSATWDSVLPDNIVGTYNAFVAAHAAGARRVVYASSIHAVSGYPVDRQVHADDPVNPGDLYGVSKCFGEAMGRYMAMQRGLSCIAVRIGAFQPVEKAREDSVRLLNAFVSEADLTSLLHASIDNEDLQFAIVHGLSDNLFNCMDITEAQELLGYRPQDNFLSEHPVLRELDLHRHVEAHDEESGQESGIRKDVA